MPHDGSQGKEMETILHCDRKWGIGRNNDLMFSLPADMKFFRETTRGKVVIMGSNTLICLPNEKPLKNRTNIVLWPGGDKSRALADGFIMADDMDEFKAEVRKYPADDVYVIGGAMMYRTMLPYCSEALITKVDADGGAEVFFENLDRAEGWRLAEQSEPVIDNGYAIRFCRYVNDGVKEL